MPAVEQTKLREQIAQLLALVDRPDEFHRALRDFMELHSQLSYRSGETITNRPLLPAYRIPPLISRQLEVELTGLSRRLPGQLLRVSDALWTDDHLEIRLLAAIILGQTPPEQAEAVIQRLLAWARPDEDRQVLNYLLNKGTTTLRKTQPDSLYAAARTWLDAKDPSIQRIGLQLLEIIAGDEEVVNIPPIFRLLSPFASIPPQALLNDLYLCLKALAKHQSAETAYFLRQIVGTSSDPGSARLIRRVIPDLPEEFQTKLRSALRAQNAL